MNSYVILATSLFAIFAFVNNGEALQCWDCTSDALGTCKDHFNTTQFPRISFVNTAVTGLPRIMNCNAGSSQFGQPQYQFGQQGRPVCMKKIETNSRYGTKTYRRSCHYLTAGEYVGTCPTRSASGDITVDFCEYCDTHECNGVQGLQKSTFLMGLIPIAVALALRK